MGLSLSSLGYLSELTGVGDERDGGTNGEIRRRRSAIVQGNPRPEFKGNSGRVSGRTGRSILTK